MLNLPNLFSVVITAFLAAVTSTVSFAQNERSSLSDSRAKQDRVEKFIHVLQSDTSLHEKSTACKWLAVLESKKAVPVLSALLSDEKLSHYARFALEPIEDPMVDEVFCSALDRLKGRLLVGVINSIGQRRISEAVDRLEKLLAHSDTDVARAAIAALGRIADSKSIKLLQALVLDAPSSIQPSVADACLACAQYHLSQGNLKDAVMLYGIVRKADLPKHLLLAATHGEIMASQSTSIPLLVQQLKTDDEDFFGVALRTSRELVDRRVTQTLIAALPRLSSERQALLIRAIGDRNDKAAHLVVLEAAKAGPTDVRISAIHSLGQLGDVSSVPVLLDAAVQSNEEVAEAAKASIVAISDEKVDLVIMAAMHSKRGKTRRVAIDLVADRRIEAAVGALVRAADDPDQKIQLSAIKALGETIGLQELSTLTNRIISPNTPQEMAAARQALRAACVRMPDQDACAESLMEHLREAPMEAKLCFLDVLGAVGGKTALKAVAASAKDSSTEIQDTATRILGEWISVDAAPELLDLAKTLDNNKFKIRALRGYIRIIRQLGLPDEQKIVMCKEAWSVAQRVEEKSLLLQVLSRIPSTEALSLVVPHLVSPSLRKEANATAVSIAEKTVQESPGAVAKAMRQVLQASENTDLRAQADRLLKRAELELSP